MHRFHGLAVMYGSPMSILRQIIRFFQNLGKPNTPPPGKVPNTLEMETEIERYRGMRGY